MDEQAFDAQLQGMSRVIRLDPNRVEFEDVREMLLFDLATRTGIKGFMNADTIVYLVDCIAAVAAYLQYSVDSAWFEGGRHTARLDDSIRAIMRTFGVRQKRKTPAHATFRINRPTGWATVMTIPPYTEWLMGNIAFFNRDPIEIAPTDTYVDVILYEGENIRQNVSGTSNGYVRFMSDEGRFVVSDIDTRVLLNNNVVNVVYTPIWKFRNTEEVQYVVEDYTTAKGHLELRFGNYIFGFAPRPEDVVTIDYIVTRGKEGRLLTTLNQSIKGTHEEFELTGIGITTMSGGSDEVSPDVYASIGPAAFASQQKAINRDGYESVPFEFDGVLDCRCIYQSIYAPNDIRFHTFIRVALLLDEPLTDPKWNEFDAFLTERGIANAHYLRYDPVAVETDVTADIYLTSVAQISDAAQRAEAALVKLFTANKGVIGRTIAVSDIAEAITNSAPNISYVHIREPKYDLYTTLRTDDDATASRITGTLGTGTWQFYYTYTPVGFDAGAGESLPIAFTIEGGSSVTTGTVGFRLNLPRWGLQGANIKIYSRYSSDGVNFTVREVFDAVPTETQFEQGIQLDVLTTTQGTSVYTGTGFGLNVVDDSGLYYNKLGAVSLNIYHTNRKVLTHRGNI